MKIGDGRKIWRGTPVKLETQKGRKRVRPMLILPSFILVIGLFSVWIGWRALRARRPVLGWLMFGAALAFGGVSIFLFWALLRIAAIESPPA